MVDSLHRAPAGLHQTAGASQFGDPKSSGGPFHEGHPTLIGSVELFFFPNKQLMKRRDFLSIFGLSVGSLLIPSRVARLIRDTCVLQNKPLITPATTCHSSVIHAVSGFEGYTLHYGDPRTGAGLPTWEEFAAGRGICLNYDRHRLAFLEEFFGYTPSSKSGDGAEDEDEDVEPEIPLDEPIPEWVADYYEDEVSLIYPSPRALAYSILSELPLCDSPKRFKGDSLGRLSFIEGDRPGSNSTYVSAPNLATIACLQHRLDELDAGILIEVDED